MLSHEHPLDALEQAIDVITFLQETLCPNREVPMSERGLCGLQLIFFALREDVERLRDHITKKSLT